MSTVARRVPLGTTARTGEKCPESGVWEVFGRPSTTAPIAKGNTMPPYARHVSDLAAQTVRVDLASGLCAGIQADLWRMSA